MEKQRRAPSRTGSNLLALLIFGPRYGTFDIPIAYWAPNGVAKFNAAADRRLSIPIEHFPALVIDLLGDKSPVISRVSPVENHPVSSCLWNNSGLLN